MSNTNAENKTHWIELIPKVLRGNLQWSIIISCIIINYELLILLLKSGNIDHNEIFEQINVMYSNKVLSIPGLFSIEIYTHASKFFFIILLPILAGFIASIATTFINSTYSQYFSYIEQIGKNKSENARIKAIKGHPINVEEQERISSQDKRLAKSTNESRKAMIATKKNTESIKRLKSIEKFEEKLQKNLLEKFKIIDNNYSDLKVTRQNNFDEQGKGFINFAISVLYSDKNLIKYEGNLRIQKNESLDSYYANWWMWAYQDEQNKTQESSSNANLDIVLEDITRETKIESMLSKLIHKE